MQEHYTMANEVRHAGIIEHIDGRRITVRVIAMSSCEACSVASHCGLSKAKERRVVVDDDHSGRRKVGDEVSVVAAPDVGRKAIALGFGLPLALMILVIFGAKAAAASDGVAALCGIGVLIPYYIVLHIWRKRLLSGLDFRIE